MEIIIPNWPAPESIHAFTTTRAGGYSQGPFCSFNLGMKKEDNRQAVLANRRLLREYHRLPAEPVWLQQQHGNHVVTADQITTAAADAAFTRHSHTICVVLTADCIPILLSNLAGTEVAAIHAGWRGLVGGVIANTIQAMTSPAQQLLAWLGPAIGQSAFIVGNEVKQQFTTLNAAFADAFKPQSTDKWQANLYTLARHQLNHCGIEQIFCSDLCTYRDPARFFSHRRDQGKTGNIASLIWINE